MYYILLWYATHQRVVNIIVASFNSLANDMRAVGGAIFHAMVWPFQMAFSVISGIFNAIRAGSAGLLSGLTGGAIQAKASGGPVNSGTPYIVGEQGPELFVPKQSGTIVPNGQTPSSGTSNTTININVGMMTGSAVEQREAAMRIFENLQDIANTKGQSVAQLIGSM